ncbi:MAG: LysM domain-containing protein [Solirubrobacterales bacterium]
MKTTRKAPSRVLAILALLAAVAAVVLVVGAATGGGGSPKGHGGQTRNVKHSKPHRSTPRFYVVKSGDTLTLIAQRTGVPVAVIQRLNPEVDPLTLAEGEKLKLR